jgi:hypothetical protein
MRVTGVSGVGGVGYTAMEDRIYDTIAAGLDRGTREFNLRDCPATEKALKAVQMDYELDFKVEKAPNQRLKVSFL